MEICLLVTYLKAEKNYIFERRVITSKISKKGGINSITSLRRWDAMKS